MRTRTPALFVATLALGASLACFAFGGVRDSGKTASESRKVDAFEAVRVRQGIHATVENGERSVEVKADENILPLVVTEVVDGALLVHFKEHSNIWSESDVVVRIRAPQVTSLDASGGASIKSESLAAQSLKVEVSGGGSVEIAALQTPQLAVHGSGGAKASAAGFDVRTLSAAGSGGATLTLSGRAEKTKLEMSGGARVKARGLAVNALEVDGSGGGSATVKSAQDVRGSLSGGSTLHVGADPRRSRVHTSGGGEVLYDDQQD